MSALGFISGIMEGMGVGSIIPLFSLVDENATAGADTFSQVVREAFAFLDVPFTIKFLLFAISMMFLLKTVFFLASSYISAVVINNYRVDVRRRLFSATLGANWQYLAKQKIGYLEQNLTTGVDNSAGMVQHMSSLLMNVFVLLIYVLLAMNVSVTVTLLSLGVAFISFVVLKPFFYRTRAISKDVDRWYRSLAHHIGQTIVGIKSIKAGAAEQQVFARADELFDNFRKLNLRLVLTGIFINSISQPLSALFILLLFAFFYKTHSFGYASFIVIVYAIYRIFHCVGGIQATINKINSVMPYLSNLQNYESDAKNHRESASGKEIFIFNYGIEAKDVFFSHEKDKEILSGINFTVPKGSTMGLIGPSGAGKTTVADLLLRLHRPTAGKILVDGKDISVINIKEWRQHIGYVPQDPFLLNDTIANNIKFYEPAITDAAAREAASLADILGFIETQPKGFDTIAGDRGILLSGGQRQRIVLAKILARKPDILILDEATNALDAESEQAIKQTINNLRGKLTIVIIAHRPSTIIDVDRLLVLNEGKIVEQGKPSVLLSDPSSYFYKMHHLGK